MIRTSSLGKFEGRDIMQAHLTSATGVEIDIMNYGVVVRDWRVPVGDHLRNVVLGFEGFEPYPIHSPHMGAVVGRVANRVRNSRFEMGGKTYPLASNAKGLHLHGGPEGLSSRIWDMEIDNARNRVRFSFSSPNGAMGYPGNVDFQAIYTLTDNRLRLDMRARTDELTPISLAQHNYFNLGQQETVLDHKVQIAGEKFTLLDDTLFPTGDILPVAGTVYDLQRGRTLWEGGVPVDYDLNYVLDADRDHLQPVARVEGEDGLLALELWTNRPGLQFYNAVTTNVKTPGLNGKTYAKHSGFCLEDQMFPDALNHAHFPSILCHPDHPYMHWCEIEIGAAS